MQPCFPAQRSTWENPSPSVPTSPLPPAEAIAPRREQFIPLRNSDLIERLLRREPLRAAEAESFRRLCRLLQMLMHHQYHDTREQLKDAYAPFDPDADTRGKFDLATAVRDARRVQVFERFAWLLERGNFVRLAKDEIDAALQDRSHWGLNLSIDFETFDRLEVYYRGDSHATRVRRRLRGAFRKEQVDVPVYQRLVLIFRFRPGRPFSKYLDTDDVYIKLFKEIPKVDLDMLLPGTKVRMSLVDRAKIALPTFSGLSIAAAKAFFAFGPTVGMWGLVGGTLGYGVRSVYGYLNTRQKYQLNLTQSLYFQNIDNNAGVIHRMVDEAEEQENREAVLAYYFLWRHGPTAALATGDLDRQIEQFVAAEVGHDVDFEVADALAKLERLELVARNEQGLYQALPLETAVERLIGHWQSGITL